MSREPEIIEGLFEVQAGSSKAGAEQVQRPGVILPTIMTLLAAVTWPAVMVEDPGIGGRIVCGLALGFTWPFWRVVQLAVCALQSKVSEEDADRLSQRFPSRSQRRSKA